MEEWLLWVLIMQHKKPSMRKNSSERITFNYMMKWQPNNMKDHQLATQPFSVRTTT